MKILILYIKRRKNGATITMLTKFLSEFFAPKLNDVNILFLQINTYIHFDSYTPNGYMSVLLLIEVSCFNDLM